MHGFYMNVLASDGFGEVFAWIMCATWLMRLRILMDSSLISLEARMMPPLGAPPRIQRVSTARRLDFEEKKRPSIEIRVIRNNDDSACDDVIKINPSDNTFNITYKDRHSNLNMKTYLVGSNGVIQYLKMMLRLLSIDEEPFEQVQFNIPCLPAIMVSPSELTSQTRDLVYDSVQMTLDNWPSVI